MGIVDLLKARAQLREKSKPKRGITIADVFQVFPSARIVPKDEPRFCLQSTCVDNPHAKIVLCKWPDGKQTLVCHACGREFGGKSGRIMIKEGERIHPLKKLEGGRGGVFCRSCYRPMTVSIVNGGYDWSCEPCAIVWRYRP